MPSGEETSEEVLRTAALNLSFCEALLPSAGPSERRSWKAKEPRRKGKGCGDFGLRLCCSSVKDHCGYSLSSRLGAVQNRLATRPCPILKTRPSKSVPWSFFDKIHDRVHGWPRHQSFRQEGARPPAPEKVENLLVVQLADIGDLMMTSVFLHELRHLFPKARITLVVAPHTALLARSCPDVDEVEIFDYRRLAGSKWLKKHSGCRAWWKEARRLWSDRNGRPPDLAFDVREDADPVQLASHIVMATSGARWKVGYELCPRLGPLRSAQLLDLTVHPKQQGHEVERQLHLLVEGGWSGIADSPLQYWATTETQTQAEEWRRSLDPSASRQFVGLHLGAGHALKQWPLKFFVEIARWLEKELSYSLLFFGDETDINDAAQVIADAGLQQAVNLAGKLPLNVAAAFMRHLHGFVGNDSGPLHLAAAAGIPVVGIYGPVDPGRYGPWKARGRSVTQALDCRPCSLRCSFTTNHCLQDLEPTLVRQAILEIFPGIKKQA